MSKNKKQENETIEEETKEDVFCEIQSLKMQAEENLLTAKYYKAELENFKKRNEGLGSAMYQDGKIHVIMNILPILDSLNDALRTVSDKEGIEIVVRKFNQVLTELGVEEIPTDIPFDPRLHNAVAAVKDDKPPDTILEVWQRGYRINGKIIRPATVKVSN